MEQKVDKEIIKKDDEPKVIVELEKVTKIFSKSVWSIKKVDLSIYKGDAIAIIGKNGSGKSTLAKLIGNQLPQTSGSIDYFFDEDNIFKAIGYQSREQSWPGGFTVKDVFRLYLAIYDVKDKEWIDKLQDIFEIKPIMNKALSKLNIIRLQLFAMFLAMLHKPELLIIDEISSSISLEIRMKIIDLFKSYVANGNSVIIVYPDDHILNAVCNRMVVLNDGEIQEDVKLKEAVQEYGSTFEFIRQTAQTIKTVKTRSKVDPFFSAIIDKYTTIYNNLFDHYNEFFGENFGSENPDLDLKVKNTLYEITLCKEKMLETISSVITLTSVRKTEKIINKTQKEITATLKAIKKHKRKTEKNIKNVNILIKDLERLYAFVNKKIRPLFQNNQFVMGKEISDLDSTLSERRKLKALKRRYIREEIKIMKLERRKIKRRKELASMSKEQRDALKTELIKEQISLENQITATHIDVVEAINEMTDSKESGTVAVIDKDNNVELIKEETIASKDSKPEETISLENETMKRIEDDLTAISELEEIEINDELTISSFFEDVESIKDNTDEKTSNKEDK